MEYVAIVAWFKVGYTAFVFIMGLMLLVLIFAVEAPLKHSNNFQKP